MDAVLPDPPNSVESLYSELRAAGFVPIEDRRGGMGGVQLILRGPSVKAGRGPRPVVQISADRGHWVVTLRFEGMSRFVDPRVWAAYLDHTPLGEPDLDEQVHFVSSRLAEAAEATEANPTIELALRQIGEDYMRRRLGL